MNHLKRSPQTLTLTTLSLFACFACSDSGEETRASRLASELQCTGADELPPCQDIDDGSRLCEDLGTSFIAAAVTYVNPDLDTATLNRPERGRICMSGALATANAASPGVEMVLSVAERANEGKRIVATFDAEALGISALRFKIDPAPNSRMTLMANVVMQCDCPDHPYSCVEGGSYTLASPDGEEPVVITGPGTIIAPFSDFVPQALEESLPGTHPLAHFVLHLDPTREALDYEFCVSEIEFLDAEGNVVTPRE